MSITTIKDAIAELSKSSRGQTALENLLVLLDQGGCALDGENQKRLLALLVSVWHGNIGVGSLRDEIDQSLKRSVRNR